MKNTFAILATIICLATLAQAPVQSSNTLLNKAGKAQIKFENMVIDFGKIKKDVPTTRDFKFTNTGNVPLIIASAHAGCGCTTPSTPKDPVLPGQTGIIGAGFNARNMGPFTKIITVTSNAQDSSLVITIKGEVIQ